MGEIDRKDFLKIGIGSLAGLAASQVLSLTNQANQGNVHASSGTTEAVNALRWSKMLFAAVIIAIPFLLTACVDVIEADIILYSGEEWKANVDLTFTQQDVSMAGGEPAIEADLQRRAAQLKEQGVRYRWRKERKEGNVVYHISVEGKGWATLNQAVFNGQAQIQSSKEGHVYFYYNAYYYYTPLFAARTYTLRLTGGKILSSNADEVRGNTAIWYDIISTGHAEATLTEATRSSLPCLGSIGLIVLLIPISMFATRHRTRKGVVNSDNSPCPA